MKKIVRLTEDKLNSLIAEAIDEALNSTSTNQGGLHLLDITNGAQIHQYIGDAYNILKKSYENIGGFLAAQNKEVLERKTDKLTIYTDGNQIYSVGVYTTLKGGTKLFGLGGDGRGARQIIQRDIKEWPTGWYWCEASGAVEYLFEKYGADNIPSFFAPELLGDKQINIIDEYHYERRIGKQGASYIKTIFGLRDEGIFNKVAEYQKLRLKNTVEYIVDNMNKVNESIEDEELRNENNAFLACNIIASISDTMEESECSELIPEQVEYIQQSIKTLQNNPNYKNATNGIRLGQFMLDNYSVLTLHKFGSNE